MSKRITIFIALTMLLTQMIAVQADSMEGDVFCGDLSNADCKILLDNAAAMDEVFAAAFSMTMDVQASGDAPEDNMQLSGTGSGSMAVDPTLVGGIMATQAETDADSMGAFVELLLTAMTGEMTLDMNIGSAEGPIDMTISLLLKDGVIAFNTGVMEELTGESMEGFEWFGVDVSGALDDVLMEAGLDTMMGADEASSMEHEMMQAAAVARLADAEVAGIPVAVFETRMDADMVTSMIAGEDLEAADAGEGELVSRQYIGLADNFTHRMTISGDMTLPKSEDGAITGYMTMVLDISIDMSAFNQPVSVEIPEDAVIFPLAMMMQMSSQ